MVCLMKKGATLFISQNLPADPHDHQQRAVVDSGWMDGWMDGWMHGWMDEQIAF